MRQQIIVHTAKNEIVEGWRDRKGNHQCGDDHQGHSHTCLLSGFSVYVGQSFFGVACVRRGFAFRELGRLAVG